jgi:uncharacterized protein (TIRG00374 family)
MGGMKRLAPFLQMAVSLTLILVLLSRIPLAAVLDVLSAASLPLLIASLPLGIVSVALAAVRWQRLLHSLGYDFPVLSLVRSLFIAAFFNTYVPGGVCGEVVRAVTLPKGESRKGLSRSYIAASVVVDKLVGTMGMIFLGIVGWVCSLGSLSDAKIMRVYAFVLGGATLFFFLLVFAAKRRWLAPIVSTIRLLFPHDLKDRAMILADALQQLLSNTRVLMTTLLLGVGANALVLGAWHMFLVALRTWLPASRLLLHLSMLDILGALPLSHAGLGVRDLSAAYLLGLEGISPDVALTLSLLMFLWYVLWGTVGMLIWCAEALLALCRRQPA